MKKKVYIDGNLLVKRGVFFGLNFCIYTDDDCKDKVDETIACNKDRIYEINNDGGSMFTEYYVKGGITMYGGNGSTIKIFKKEHEQTYTKFKYIEERIIMLLETTIIPDECKNYFYQQQYISLYANLEYFLYSTFLWETCQCHESYKRVLPILAKYSRNSQIISILKGVQCILQEITFVEQVKYIVYHRNNKVNEIYKAAFDIDIDLSIFDEELDIRNDIVHRAGYTKDDKLIQMTKEQVISLKDKIETLVEQITQEIAIFKETK